MITALDISTLQAAQQAQSPGTATGDPGLFATQLAQILAANAQLATGIEPQSNEQTLAQNADPNAVLAAQIQTNLMAQAASQPQPSTEDAQQTQQNAILQNLNFQASLAFSQRNVPAFMAIETMIAQHMAAMNPAQAAQTGAASSAGATTTAAKARKSTGVALTKTASTADATKTTASNASTASSSTVQTASNASTTNSSSAQTASNANTANSASTQTASNAGTGGTSTAQAASNAGTGGTSAGNASGGPGLEALDFMAGVLASELAGLSGNDLAAALDDVAALAQAWFAQSPPGASGGDSGTAVDFLVNTLASEIAGLSGPDRAQALDQLARLADKWSKPASPPQVQSAA